MEVTHEDSGDLVILRSKTTDRLEAESDVPQESSLLLMIRCVYSTLIIISCILITSPRSAKINGVPMDATLNITVIPNCAIHMTNLEAGVVTSEGITKDLYGDERVDSKPRILEYEVNVTKRTSVLAVPALFGRPPTSQKIVAPLVVLNIDSCREFRFKFPETFQMSLDKHEKHDLQTPNPTILKRMRNSMSSIYNAFFTKRSSQEEGSYSEDFDNEVPNQNWFALVRRGNCPFDIKVYNAYHAGFAGIIVYNNENFGITADAPVRMSANKLGTKLKESQAMFLTSFDGKSIVQDAIDLESKLDIDAKLEIHKKVRIIGTNRGVIGVPLMISIDLDSWPVDGWGATSAMNIKSKSIFWFLSDIICLLIVFAICGAFCTTVSLFVMMIRNYFVHGRMFVVLMAPDIFYLPRFNFGWGRRDRGPFPEEGSGQDICKTATLEKLVLALRIITADDLADPEEVSESSDLLHPKRSTATGGSRNFCAICIDEFAVGCKTRELPCHHQFHHSW